MAKQEKQTFAIDLIAYVKRKRDFWRAVAVVSIALNIIQWLFL